jgi:formylglycine-generating enzyme required for sulfatase activity
VEAPAWATITNLGSGRIQATLVPPATAQTANLTLSVADGSGLESRVTIPISIQAGGGLQIEDLPATVNSTIEQGNSTFFIRAVAISSNASNSTWSISGDGGFASIEAAGDSVAKITVLPGSTITRNVTVTATSGNLSGTAVFSIRPENLPLRFVDFPESVAFRDNRTKLSIPLLAEGGAVHGQMTWSVAASPSNWARIIWQEGRSAVLEVDRNGFATSATANITVTDGVSTVTRPLLLQEANEAPTLVLPGSVFAFNASSRPARVLLTAEDRNISDSLSWSIQPSGGKVSLVAINNRSAELVIDATQPFAASNFTVRVSDGNLSTSANLSLSVTNTAPVISGPEGSQEFQVGSGIREMTFAAVDPDKNQQQTLSLSGNGSWLSWRYNGPASILVSVDTSVAVQGVLTLNATDGLASAMRQVSVAVVDGPSSSGSPALVGLPGSLNLKRFSPSVALPFTISDNDSADVHTVKLAFDVPGVRVELGEGQRAGRILIDPIQGQNGVPIIFELSDGKETVRSVLQLTLAAEAPDSHQIVLAEYFFNTEPAPGSGFVIPASNNEPFNDTAFYERFVGIYGDLPIGWNRVGMRFKTADGQWSSTAWRNLYIFEDAPRTVTAFVRPDGSVAYSVNNDFSPIGSNSTLSNWGTQFVDTDPGIQALPVQNLIVENNTGVEHLENAIVWAEYFINTDPGPGNGIPLPMDRRVLDSTVPSFEFAIDSSQLSVGAHRLGLRLRMADGTWGGTRNIAFQVFEDVDLQVPPKAEVTESEYAWDATVSPGFGFGIELESSTIGTEIGLLNNSVHTAPLDLGNQGIFLRFKTNSNDWGNSMKYDFVVTAPDAPLNLVTLNIQSNIGSANLGYDTKQLVGTEVSVHVPIVFNLNGVNWANWGYSGSKTGESNFVSLSILANAQNSIRWIWGRDCMVISRSAFGNVTASPGNLPEPYGWNWDEEGQSWFGTFAAAEPITLSVPPFVSVATGTRQFSTGWTGSGSAPASGKVNEVTFSPLAQISEVNWTWRKEHLLTVVTEGDGQVYGNFGWIQEGGTANLLAIPNPGHHFVRWELAHSGNSTSAEILMTEPKTVRAVFAKMHRVWSVEPISWERKLVGVYASGSQVSLTVPKFHDLTKGSRFVVTDWKLLGNQTSSGTGQIASFTVNSDCEVRWNGVRQHLVEKRVNAHGSISVTGVRAATDGDWFDEGVVGISAVSSNSSVFVEWLNELAGAPSSVQLRLESPLIADAVFRTRDSTFRSVAIPAGVIKNSPNSTRPDFNEMIEPFEIGETEVTNNQFTAELNAALTEKSVRIDSNMVYSRKELPLFFDGLSVDWLSSNNSVLRRDRVANLNQALARPADLINAAKGVLNGQVYVGARHLGYNLVLSGTGNATVNWNGQQFVGTLPISVPMGSMGWRDLQIDFATPASSLTGISMGTNAQNEDPFSSSLVRYSDVNGHEPLKFFLGKIGASPNEQLEFQQAVVNLGSHTQNSAESDFGFAECAGDFDLIATVSRPTSGTAGLAARDGIRASTPELTLAVGPNGTLLINNQPTTSIVRQAWTLRLSRRGDTFAAEFLDLDGKWKDAKTGTLALTAHQVTSLKGSQPCLAGVFVDQTSASFTGVSLNNLANNYSRNNLLILDMGWPGSGITFNGTSFQSAVGGTSPVTCVTYHGAKIFANWKEERRQDGDYDLPSEWEHEYLAGGKLGKSYPWDGASTGFANLEGSEPLFNGNSLSPVATFSPIEGIYDLAGNAWEWTNSDQLAGNSLWKTIRGGSFRSPLPLASSSFRLFYGRDTFVSSEVGFRVVRRPSEIASPYRLLLSNNLSLESVTQGNIRGFNNPLSDFEISANEVSNADFCAFLNEINYLNKISVVSGQVVLAGNNKVLLQLNGNVGVQIVGNQFTPLAGKEGFAVSNVTWHGADEFAKWLTSKNDVWAFRLPTESEWEASAEAGYNASSEKLIGYMAGNVWSTQSRIFGDSGNQWGLNRLLGGGAEWTGSQAIGIPNMMIVRGGVQFPFSNLVDPENRSQYLLKDSSDSNLGFRLARVAKTPWKASTETGSFSAKFDSSIVDEGGKLNLIVSRTGDPIFASNFSINSTDSRIQLPQSPRFGAGESVKTYSINVTSDTAAQGVSNPTVTLLSESGERLDLRLTVVDRSLSSVPTFDSEYAQWLLGFPSLPSAKRGISDDADGDGLPNFAEFALSRNPNLSAVEENAMVSVSGGQVQFTFKRRKNISGIGLGVNVSTTESLGGAWQTFSGSEQIIQEDSQSETVRISLPIQGKSKTFFRILVRKQ